MLLNCHQFRKVICYCFCGAYFYLDKRKFFAVFDIKTGLQFRFGMPRTSFFEAEMKNVEELIQEQVADGDIFVTIGSLPKGLSIDYYSKLIKNLTAKCVKVIADTSGPGFNEVLKNELFLIKPNQKELARLAGKESLS